jgi:hypothetical protein
LHGGFSAGFGAALRFFGVDCGVGFGASSGVDFETAGLGFAIATATMLTSEPVFATLTFLTAGLGFGMMAAAEAFGSLKRFIKLEKDDILLVGLRKSV